MGTIIDRHFFVWALFRMGTIIETLVPFEVISSGCNAIVVPFQQLQEGPMELLLCERVNDLCHSFFHLLNCLIMTASGQIVCDKDGFVYWWIVLVEMPLTRFEECWPLPTESLPELP